MTSKLTADFRRAMAVACILLATGAGAADSVVTEPSATELIAEAVSVLDAIAPLEGRAFERSAQTNLVIHVELDRAGIRVMKLADLDLRAAATRGEIKVYRRAQIEVYRALRRWNAGLEQDALSHARNALEILAEPIEVDAIDAIDSDDAAMTRQSGVRHAQGGRR